MAQLLNTLGLGVFEGEADVLAAIDSLNEGTLAVALLAGIIVVQAQASCLQPLANIGIHIRRYYSSRELIEHDRTFKLSLEVHGRTLFSYRCQHIIELLCIFFRQGYSIFFLGISYRVALASHLFQTCVSSVIEHVTTFWIDSTCKMYVSIAPFVCECINVRMVVCQLAFSCTDFIQVASRLQSISHETVERETTSFCSVSPCFLHKLRNMLQVIRYILSVATWSVAVKYNLLDTITLILFSKPFIVFFRKAVFSYPFHSSIRRAIIVRSTRDCLGSPHSVY